jgi:hypothetical protein
MKPIKSNGYTPEQAFKMCESKLRYPDEITARAAGMASLEQLPDRADRLYTYNCPLCRGWHLTKRRNRAESVGCFAITATNPYERIEK